MVFIFGVKKRIEVLSLRGTPYRFEQKFLMCIQLKTEQLFVIQRTYGKNYADFIQKQSVIKDFNWTTTK